MREVEGGHSIKTFEAIEIIQEVQKEGHIRQEIVRGLKKVERNNINWTPVIDINRKGVFQGCYGGHISKVIGVDTNANGVGPIIGHLRNSMWNDNYRRHGEEDCPIVAAKDVSIVLVFLQSTILVL